MSKLSGNRAKRRAYIVNVNQNIDATNPEGAAMCDGCSFWIPWKSLRKRMDYRGGSTPVWTGYYVCATCDDVPNAQFARPRQYRDPIALPHARIDTAMTVPGGNSSNSGYGYLVDQNGNYICATPYLDYGLHPLITEIAGLPDTSWP